MTEKKPLEQLMAERNEYRHLINKTFRHIKSGQHYQLLMVAHDTETQALNAVYCMSAMSQFKFTRSMVDFVEKFEEAVG